MFMRKDDTVTIEQAREILGSEAKSLTDNEINELIMFFEEVSDRVLNEFERATFGTSLNKIIDV